MRSVVMKFGGSSVADATAIGRVAAIVAAERGRGRAPVVVVSALGGVTDRLLALAEAARTGSGRAEIEEALTTLRRRHLDEAARLGADVDGTLVPALDRHFADLRSALQNIEAGASVEPAVLDIIAATGELLSSRMVAAAL